MTEPFAFQNLWSRNVCAARCAGDHAERPVDSHIGLRAPGMADSADTRWLSNNEAATDAAIGSSSPGPQGGSPTVGLRSRGTPTAMGSSGAIMSAGAAAFNGPASGAAPLGHGWGGRGSKVQQIKRLSGLQSG